jgi:hypothetical protein
MCWLGVHTHHIPYHQKPPGVTHRVDHNAARHTNSLFYTSLCANCLSVYTIVLCGAHIWVDILFSISSLLHLQSVVPRAGHVRAAVARLEETKKGAHVNEPPVGHKVPVAKQRHKQPGAVLGVSKSHRDYHRPAAHEDSSSSDSGTHSQSPKPAINSRNPLIAAQNSVIELRKVQSATVKQDTVTGEHNTSESAL